MDSYMERIDKRVADELERFADMAADIHAHPELGGEEFRTSALLAGELKSRGWDVESPYMGLPTAFNAVRRNGDGPLVSFMAEYDALPEIGHACGHNLNGVMSLLAGIALADALGDDLRGEIRIVGTPAEETNGAKVEMSEKGVFDGVDFAMMAHASAGVAYPAYRSLALVPVEFTFKGLASHAAASPWDGLNALNGLQLFFHALDMLRQHVKPDTRIHGVITKGGDAPNIVPDLAQASFYFRSPNREYLDKVLEKVYNCARGAALCTGTEVSRRNHETSFREILPNPEAERAMAKVLDELGIPYSSEPRFSGSTDVGDVSWRCPTLHIHMPFTDKNMALHTREFAAVTGDRGATVKGISNGARAIARMGLLALTDEEFKRKTREDFEKK
ncbi:amidohydrolase [Synergistales bacterium]|nr:amidohydrolase [Synergistales bacterium]